METTTTITTQTPARRAAIHSLAVVGFIALVIIGMTLAVYAARYVPKALSSVSTAAVYLSSIFVPGEPSSLTVVPTTTATTTITTIVIGTTTPATTTMAVAPASTPVTTPKPTGTYPVTTTYPTPGSTQVVVPQNLYGLPNLVVTITEKGYLTSTDTSSFVKSNTVPNGKRPAVRFTVTNTGTNETGTWDFEAEIPTTRSYTFSSPNQDSLLPGAHIDFVLGFDHADDGDDRTISITVDPDHDITESNEQNTAEVTIDID